MNVLGLSTEALAAAGAQDTAREIAQQPETLAAVHALLMQQASTIAKFLTPLISRADLRIVLTGAGTSAFVGDSLAPYLASQLACRVQAIATTDIVAGPGHYLERDTPTLLISFGRSGNSPESVAAIDLASQLIRECHHLVITCNVDGALATRVSNLPQAHVIVLPDATHDRGFAMTSSFTGMMYAALACLSGIPEMSDRIGPITAAVRGLIASSIDNMRMLAAQDFDRVIYLGSSGLQGIAREAALKLLELSDGDIIAVYDTPMGFRHGPKTIVTPNSLIFVLISNDPYTRRYDLDLLAELRGDAKSRKIIAISAQPLGGADIISIPFLEAAQDCDLLFAMIIVPQIFAFYASLAHGKTPDSPNAAGLVNRVVQGVAIHALPAP